MCGVWTRTKYDQPVEVEELLHPVRSLWHRGPDGYRWYSDDDVAMLHTRLSIIDLAGGAQPLFTNNGRWVGVVNGELYDYEDLRTVLESHGVTFQTRSDSEVLMNLFVHGGARALSQVSGEFAFIFYDKLERKLHFGRDPFGVKPLFFERRRDRFTLASEIKAISDETPVLDEVYVKSFIARAMIPPRTSIEGVEHVLPGRVYTLDLRDRSLTSEVYHPLPLFQKRDLEGRDAEEAFETEIRGAIRRRLRADVDVGCYLSGGVDSSLIASIAADMGAKPHVFTAAFRDKNYDESREAAQIASDLGLEHSTIELTSSNFLPSLIDSIVAFENPIGNPHGAAKNLLSSLARKHVKVVLTGEGSDEWFGGYAYLRSKKIQEFARNHPKLAKNALQMFMEREGIRNVGHLEGGSEAFDSTTELFFRGVSPAVLGRLARRRWFRFFTGDDLSSLVPALSDTLSMQLNEEAPSGSLSEWDVNTWVSVRTDLLNYILANVGDRQEMAHSIEGRTPFLDPRVVSVACRIAEKDLLSGLTEKKVVRKVAAKYLKPEHSQRGKRPFFAPIKYLYLRDNREALNHYLGRAREATPWLAWRNIDRLIDSKRGHKNVALSNQLISMKLTLFSIGVIHEKLRDTDLAPGSFDLRPFEAGSLLAHKVEGPSRSERAACTKKEIA